MLEELNQFFSNIPPIKSKVIAGIDEAGRGPVVGPMVYAIYVMEVSEHSNYKDSKQLTPKQRESFFQNMKNYSWIAVSPVYITSHMDGDSKNLNTIAKETVLHLLRELKNKCSQVEAVYIDGLGDNEAYKRYLENFFDFKFIIEDKADTRYQVVSGASIVAKVTRDSFVSNYSCGSGYPSDPKTKSWLRQNMDPFYGFPETVRHSWQTVKTLLGEKKSRRLSNSLSCFYTGPN